MPRKRKLLLSILIQIVLFLVLTLPFHYVISERAIFMKKSPSFEKTFITEEQVREIIENYYLYATPSEKVESENDPLIAGLTDRWRVFFVDGQIVFERRKN